MKRRKVGLAGIVAASVMILSLPAAGVSATSLISAKTSKATTYSYVYNQHGKQVPVQGVPHVGPDYPLYFTVDNGTKTEMTCWTDTEYSTGNYRSNRWFYVKFYTPRFGALIGRGYVHSSYVYYQTSVPHC